MAAFLELCLARNRFSIIISRLLIRVIMLIPFKTPFFFSLLQIMVTDSEELKEEGYFWGVAEPRPKGRTQTWASSDSGIRN